MHTLKKVLLIAVVFLIVGFVSFVGFVYYGVTHNVIPITPNPLPPELIGTTTTQRVTQAKVSVIARGLEIPWDLRFLPNGDMLVSERPGRIVRISPTGIKTPISYESDASQRGEGGLLGIALHPDFAQNGFVYLYLSTSESGGTAVNMIERFRLDGNALVEKKVITTGIPGSLYHDGGRMEFGPDGYLYVTTGDATHGPIAQDKTSLGGKILRLTDDGSPAPGNPFDTRVYSYGHRNPQGLAWDNAGRLWETEHGPTGENGGQCCHDEINLIQAGGNYGWPTIIGSAKKEGMITPAWNSEMNTWAPASLVYLNGRLFFGALKGEALYEAVLDGDKVVELKTHFKNEFGRIRTVRLGPDGFLYLTTSNRDGRGTPNDGDDKIIRVDPKQL